MINYSQYISDVNHQALNYVLTMLYKLLPTWMLVSSLPSDSAPNLMQLASSEMVLVDDWAAAANFSYPVFAPITSCFVSSTSAFAALSISPL